MVHAVEVRPWVTAAETSPLPAGGRGTIKSTRVSWMRGLLNLVQRWPEMKGSPYVGIKKTKAFHFAPAKNMVVGVSFLTHLRYCQKRTSRSFSSFMFRTPLYSSLSFFISTEDLRSTKEEAVPQKVFLLWFYYYYCDTILYLGSTLQSTKEVLKHVLLPGHNKAGSDSIQINPEVCSSDFRGPWWRKAQNPSL